MSLNGASCRKLIYIQVVYVSLVMFCVTVLKLPSALTYVTDIFMLPLMLFLLMNRNHPLKQVGAGYVSKLYILYAFVIVIGLILNLVPPLLVLWGLRNGFRGAVFMIACVSFLTSADVRKIFDIFFWLQIVNIPVTLYQYFILGLTQDKLGGIFGIEKGCNGYSNLFFIILLSYYTTAYFAKKTSFLKLLFVVASTILIAAVAEIKFYYYEFAIIVVLCILFSKPSKKSILFVILAGVVMLLSLSVIERIFPDQAAVVTNVDETINYASTEGGGYNISRLGAFSKINQLFFHGDPIKNLFGQGLGSCEMSAYSFLTSDFYKEFGHYNYRWFSHMMLFLETGYCGLILNLSIFIAVFIHALKHRRALDKSGSLYIAAFVQILSLMGIINTFYNASLRAEPQYLYFFAISACMVYCKSAKESRHVSAAAPVLADS